MNIWVFAEERSGSTWLCAELANKLNKPFVYLDSYHVCLGAIHQTHNFEVLQKGIDGIILRTTRKDSIEHMLSYIFLARMKVLNPEWWEFPHVWKDSIEAEITFKKIIDELNIEITENEVKDYIDLKKQRDKLWDAYSKPKQTIFYEDLHNGVDIPELNLSGITFRTGGKFKKLLWDKRSVIRNSDQASIWYENFTYGIK